MSEGEMERKGLGVKWDGEGGDEHVLEYRVRDGEE